MINSSLSQSSSILKPFWNYKMHYRVYQSQHPCTNLAVFKRKSSSWGLQALGAGVQEERGWPVSSGKKASPAATKQACQEVVPVWPVQRLILAPERQRYSSYSNSKGVRYATRLTDPTFSCAEKGKSWSLDQELLSFFMLPRSHFPNCVGFCWRDT